MPDTLVPMDDLAQTRRYLDLAARMAMRAAGYVEPNPMVGCVIARAGEVLGIGHHRVFGGLHAEREALANCRARGHDPRGATAYVTLEPCKHYGKQPPCTQAMVEAGIARVVCARRDPGAESGGGLEVLKQAGIACEFTDVSQAAIAISDAFVKRQTTQMPWVIAKWAQTIDGRIATRTGESKWISGLRSRRRVHAMRSRMDIMLTGIGTVLADDPMLTARADMGVKKPRRVARRVVIDTDLHMPLASKLVRTAEDVPTTVACMKDMVVQGISEHHPGSLEAMGVDVMGVPEVPWHHGWIQLDMLMRALVERYGATNVMVEAGAGLLGTLFEADLIDEAVVYVAPILFGDEQAMAAATGRVAEHLSSGRRFTLVRAKRVDQDVELVYRRVREPEQAPEIDETQNRAAK